MKKNVIISIVTIILLGSIGILTYQENGEKEPVIDEEKVVVTIWTKDRHDAKFQQEKITAYNKDNTDNIYVDYKMFGENYVQSVNNALDNGNGPDIMVYTADIFFRDENEGEFADIAPYMDDTFREVFKDVMVENVNVFDNKCYFIPTTISTSKLIYNKAIFERVGIKEPPRTMKELVEYSKEITAQLKHEGIYGFAANMNNAQSALVRSLMKQARMDTGIQNGYDFSKGQYDFTTYKTLLVYWRELMGTDSAYPNCKELDIDPLRQLFAQGKIGMYISYLNAEMSIYKNQFPAKDEWGYVDIPTVVGDDVMQQNCALNNGYLFNADSPHVEAAWKAYRALFGNEENLTEYYLEGFGTSIIPQVIKEGRSQGYYAYEPAFDIKEYQDIWPGVPHELEPEFMFVEGLDMYETFKQLIFGTSDIQQALIDLGNRYNRVYEEAISEGNIQKIE